MNRHWLVTSHRGSKRVTAPTREQAELFAASFWGISYWDCSAVEV